MFNNYKQEDYFLAFNHFEGIGPARFKKIESYFPDLNEAFAANSNELEKSGLDAKTIKKFIEWRATFSLEEAILSLKKENINFITWHDSKYPKLLLEIPSPPPILYYKGSLDDQDNTASLSLAVVGSRQPSIYAKRIIYNLINPLIKQGITIISGLALGIDSLAHQAALSARGRTIAVLGSGLNRENFYPFENIKIAEEIIKTGGSIISEFSPNTPPLKQNFPRRNRIISGLAQATLIIEAKNKSGSLITANYALDQNREVLAVPGNIFSPYSEGTNKLIREGATPITCSEDILEIFKISSQEKKKMKKDFDDSLYKSFNPQEKIIFDCLLSSFEAGGILDTDELIKKTKLDTAIINSTLSILELKEAIKNINGTYSLNI